jgi:hypothetical protein
MIRSGPWSAAVDVGGWLRGLGLGQYEALFRASEIDADILPELTDVDLEKLGVPLGHRKRLLRAISGLTAAETSAAPSAATGPKPQDAAERRQLAAAVTRLETRGTERLAVRIGIATGLVVVGDLVGQGSAQEQAVVGETPNLAARLAGSHIGAGAHRRDRTALGFPAVDPDRRALSAARPECRAG